VWFDLKNVQEDVMVESRRRRKEKKKK